MAALSASCPRCGAKGLFVGPAQLAERCPACGLPFGGKVNGGRFGALLALLVAVVVGAVAIAIDSALRPPLWGHFVIWPPVTALGVIGALRLALIVCIKANYFKSLDKGAH